MNHQTILQLNVLNREFYRQVADDFDKSRQEPWEGWLQLAPLWQSFKTPVVWDIGCGNGRFAMYLQKVAPTAQYQGFDNSGELLAKAHAQLPRVTFNQLDLVSSWQDGTLKDRLPTTAADLIVLFGVMHHLPSQELRLEVSKLLASKLKPGGALVIAAWQFLKDPSLAKRVIDPQKIHLDPKQLEKNDYILDWKRGQVAYRYCHQLDQTELKQIVKATGLTLEDDFLADGKEKNLNHYLVLRRTKKTKKS